MERTRSPGTNLIYRIENGLRLRPGNSGLATYSTEYLKWLGKNVLTANPVSVVEVCHILSMLVMD